MADKEEKKVDVKEILTALRDTDLAKDNDAQFKAVQLLKGLAVSEDPMSNEFMKKLETAINSIVGGMLKSEKNESSVEKNEFIDEAAKYL